MTDTIITPVAAPKTATDAPPQQPPEAQPAPTAAEKGHTPGGWPVVPLAVTGTNTTATLLGAAALVGGPAAVALAATGAVVVGTAAVSRSRRKHRKAADAGRTPRATQGGRKQGGNGVGQMPQPRPGTRRTGAPSRTGAKGAPSTGRTGALGKGAARPAGSPTLRKAASTPLRNAPSTQTGSPLAQARSKAGKVRQLRASAREQVPASRAGRRADTTGARRSLADARRAAKAQARTASLAHKGLVGRAAAKGLGTARKARSAALERQRAARERSAHRKVAQERSALRKAPARARARKALRRSAARFEGRRLLAALLAAALGVVGFLTSPIGRKLGIPWLIHPGRRLYRRLTHTARQQREQRDEQIRAAQTDEETTADGDADDVGDRVERPVGVVPAAPAPSTTEGEIVSGFRFEEYAAEMESAAQSYEPENALEILAMVEGLPAALASVANVMKILAERADGEFPLEKEVADGFNDIYGALMAATAVAEDMGPLFRQSHEKDIARHEDPRNGPEAEKGWNV
ncbi:hypothetical protein [Streptomyces chumphonensis]|uniref:hypothetical protein n=1 Tax=Streptomyces chumphonensis TaxID=1214925 RepID=UPI003D74F0A3